MKFVLQLRGLFLLIFSLPTYVVTILFLVYMAPEKQQTDQ